MSEQDIQRAIMEWLEFQYPPPRTRVQRLPVGPMIVGNQVRIPNPLAGMPDIWVLHEGRSIFLEVKRPGQEAEPHQEAVHRELREAGATVAVVHSIEEAMMAMAEVSRKPTLVTG